MGVSVFVCFLTRPPWGRRSCTRNHSHHWHTQQQGNNSNETSTARVLPGTHTWKEVAAEGHCLGTVKKARLQWNHLNGQIHKAKTFSIATGFSSTWPMARTPCQEQHHPKTALAPFTFRHTHTILADTIRSYPFRKSQIKVPSTSLSTSWKTLQSWLEPLGSFSYVPHGMSAQRRHRQTSCPWASSDHL